MATQGVVEPQLDSECTLVAGNINNKIKLEIKCHLITVYVPSFGFSFRTTFGSVLNIANAVVSTIGHLSTMT